MSRPRAQGAAPPVAGDWSELLRWRTEFPILQHTTYLVNHSLGAMPTGPPPMIATLQRSGAMLSGHARRPIRPRASTPRYR